MRPVIRTAEPLYRRLALQLERQIEKGVLRVGDKVPSVRFLSRQHQVSISTVLEAYFWLEGRGFIEARSRSGFYVRIPYTQLIPEPKFRERESPPKKVGTGAVAVIDSVLRSVGDASMIPLGAACPDPELFPTRNLNRHLRSVLNRQPLHSARYDFPPGSEPLRRQIARRSLEFGCNFAPDELVITCGALEGINLALRAVARPGDVIALESPTYFGFLQAIESLGMRAIEIPTHLQSGMDLEALEHAIRKHHVKACVVMTTGHNPLGYVLTNEQKKNLVDLTARYEVPLLEDDLYGDLAFEGRPHTTKSFDRNELVLLCSSFSKVLAPGFRVGWIHPGRFRAEVERLKFITTIASPSLQQIALANFLESGGYERYLKRLRVTFAQQVQTFSRAIAKYFPQGTRITRPKGGYVLWVELPGRVDAFELYQAALKENISILPGVIFSPTARFKNHIRISCGYPWSDQMDRALLTLGRMCHQSV
jgi:DNA-binding transcriptional MocR family regulator